MKYNFDEIIERRGTNSYKWDLVKEDGVIPMWVADMDFQTAPCIIEALQKRVAHGIFGYTLVPDSYYEAIISWFARRHQWNIEKDWILYTSGVVPAISCCLKAICMPGEKVLVQTPVYNCFFSCITNSGCEVVENELKRVGNCTYEIDFEDFERKCADEKTTAFILCNPHNPAGRVWKKEELERMNDICLKHGVKVIADEIHCELIMPGYQYTPFASISEACRENSVVLNSPSKSFNIAGLQIANIICPDAALRRRINRAININEVCDVNPFGVIALQAAYNEGEEIRFTYKDLKEQSDKAAAYFQSLGIGHDDKVMLILKRHYQWWLAMLGLHKLGAVAIPATHMLTKHDIVYRNNAASVKAIICCGDDYVVEQVNQAMPESPTVKTLISIGPDIPEGFHDWMKEWNECAPFVRPEHVNSNEDTLLMYFTSGTTGEPKMVAHDHLYALGHLTTGVYWHNLHENSIHLTVADTGWGKAVWGKLYGQWFAGATVFVFDHEKFTADKIMRQIEKYHITSFCAPPTIYRFMIQEDFSKYDLSSLEYCTTAGEAMNPSVAETFQKLTGVQIYEGFGQTETTMTLGTFPWIKPKPGSMGKPNPQYDVHILRPDMTECEDGEKGEICIRIGDNKPIGLFKYYYRDEKQTKSVWHDGYYHTGDMAWRDEEGAQGHGGLSLSEALVNLNTSQLLEGLCHGWVHSLARSGAVFKTAEIIL